tara:strand:+ start:526 stop:663 length:138 start_codon:yes stop_codon:yes gene_type:complete
MGGAGSSERNQMSDERRRRSMRRGVGSLKIKMANVGGGSGVGGAY